MTYKTVSSAKYSRRNVEGLIAFSCIFVILFDNHQKNIEVAKEKTEKK